MTIKKAKEKVVRRRRRKSGRKPYFDKNTHDAIVKYQGAESHKEKHEIYVTQIMPAFNKLAENLIFIHGFAKNSPEPYENIKRDCVSFLFETLGKFDASRGTKAFSYFNVVAKNWLIIRSKKNVKNRMRHVSIDDAESVHSVDPEFFEKYSTYGDQEKEILKKESMDSLFQMMIEIKDRLHNENEIACMNAIVTLFGKIDDLDLLNKRAVFVYMRELSSLTPKQLSVAMSSIRKHYKDLVKDDRFEFFF